MSKTKVMLATLGLTLALSNAHAERPPLAGAKQDPFVIYAPPAPKVVKPKTIAIAPSVAPVAAPLPKAPDLGLQYAGQMTTPSGERQVFAVQQDQLLTLKVGTELTNGYVVQAIDAKVVRFRYPALNTSARLNLPDSPIFESR